jgi:hypothetical protein
MVCGTGCPISLQLCAAECSCDLIQRPSLPSGEPELELKRMINYLEGHKGEHYDSMAGGMSYKHNIWPDLGQGVIPDLERVIKGVQNYPLDRSVAVAALKIAETARDLAVKGLRERKFQEAARVVCPLLHCAREAILA